MRIINKERPHGLNVNTQSIRIRQKRKNQQEKYGQKVKIYPERSHNVQSWTP